MAECGQLNNRRLTVDHLRLVKSSGKPDLERHWVALFLIFLTFIGCQSRSDRPKAAEVDKPNILWIVGENFKLDFGCYGAENVYTPNIDSLAAHGLKFTNVFSTSPVCAPSRSAFMTGMYQTTTDTHHMRSHREDDFRLPNGVRPITHRLQDAGYFTANISFIGDQEVGTGKLDLNFVNEGPIYQSKDWTALKDNQPFFAQINMPEAEYDIYDRKSAEKPRVKWVGEDIHPQIATSENVTPPPYYPDHQITREEWARYLNSASGMDVRIGHVLDQLRKENLADNTIVVFFADNGRLEARGIHWMWDTGLHVPLIITWPEDFKAPPQYRPGTTIDQVISLLDLTATTLWMAGIAKPQGMQSRNFLGSKPDPPRNYAFSARDRIDETQNRIRSVRGDRYHYLRNFVPGTGFASLNRYKEKCFLVKPLMRTLYAQGKLTGAAADLMEPLPYEQLYDSQADPHEINNLIDSQDPEHLKILGQMRMALDQWIEETGDRGAIPEPPEIVAPFEQEMHDWFGTPEWYSK
jgi:arylsulfatase A-like enzyme